MDMRNLPNGPVSLLVKLYASRLAKFMPLRYVKEVTHPCRHGEEWRIRPPLPRDLCLHHVYTRLRTVGST